VSAAENALAALVAAERDMRRGLEALIVAERDLRRALEAEINSLRVEVLALRAEVAASSRTRKTETFTYSVAEAAAKMQVSRATLYTRIREGNVLTFKWGGRTLIRADDLQAAIDLASGRSGERALP
jgi:excisionase family DNA binding protein